LVLLHIVQGHGSANGFLVVRKDCLEGHELVISRHMVPAGRLNAVAFDVGSLILKVQQQPKLEAGVRNGHFDAVRLGLLPGIT
jgi:hypothetical protein